MQLKFVIEQLHLKYVQFFGTLGSSKKAYIVPTRNLLRIKLRQVGQRNVWQSAVWRADCGAVVLAVGRVATESRGCSTLIT